MRELNLHSAAHQGLGRGDDARRAQLAAAEKRRKRTVRRENPMRRFAEQLGKLCDEDGEPLTRHRRAYRLAKKFPGRFDADPFECKVAQASTWLANRRL